MTPTEQDKELQEAIYALDRLRVKIDPNLPRIGSVMARVDDIVALITADRKRVALEARIDELESIKPELLKRSKNVGYYYGYKSLRDTSIRNKQSETARLVREQSVKRIVRRIAELKSQQEEV